MPDQITVTRGPADGTVVLTVYPSGDQPVRLELSPKRAALIGLELLSLVLEPVFRLGAESKPAGHGAQPADPPA